jgi:hypothetical protein
MVNMPRHDDTQASLSELRTILVDTKSAVNALGEQLKAREHHERELMALIEKKDEQIDNSYYLRWRQA